MQWPASGGHLSKHTNHGDRALVDEDKQFTPDAEQDFVMADIGDSGAEKTPKNKKRSAGTWLGYGALVFVLLLVGAGVFLLHELRSQTESLGSGLDKGDKRVLDMQSQISRLEADLQTIHQQLVNVQTDTATEKSDFERAIHQEDAVLGSQLEALRTDLGGSLENIQRQLHQTRGSVAMAEAEYLISIANERLRWSGGDIGSVIAMLNAADHRLDESEIPDIVTVRNALAEEINLLKDFKENKAPDIVGLSAKLLALESRIKDLPLLLPHADRAKENRQPAGGEEKKAQDGGWLGSVEQDVKSLVTIRRTEREIHAILTPEEATMLKQVLVLRLEMTRAALLREDDKLYQANLAAALEWLAENFDADAALTKSMAEELKELQTKTLRVDSPSIGASLELLQHPAKWRTQKTAPKAQPKQDSPSPTEKAPSAPEAPLPGAGPAGNLPAAEPLPEEGAKP